MDDIGPWGNVLEIGPAGQKVDPTEPPDLKSLEPEPASS